jgi:Mg2+-importing ATPase
MRRTLRDVLETGTDQAWTLARDAVLAKLGTSPDGLTAVEAAMRLTRLGPNTIQAARRTDALSLLIRQFASPIVLILVFATILSGLLGDLTDTLIILAIIGLSGALGFWQERGASRAVSALLAVVRVTADVLRDGAIAQVPVENVVPGDVVVLSAGDIVPGDCLVIDSRTLLVDEAALTGETYPAEKKPGAIAASEPITRRTNAVFLGTHVVSGSGKVTVVTTGRQTEFGRISARVATHQPATGFERGMTSFGRLLVGAMLVLVGGIFVINLVLARPLIDSALFSLALAVGLTPQLLPAIVTISLSQGARSMAKRRVIVKRLDAIEDFGAMSILCTDKTGTMTAGTVVLQQALDVDGQPSTDVRRLAFLNASLQTGFENPIDAAIVAAGGVDASGARVLDELPYDFTRRRLSVLVADGAERIVVTKGAVDSVLAVCTRRQASDGSTASLAGVVEAIKARNTSLSADGYRVLAVAARKADGIEHLTAKDESDLVFRGFLVFLDPPKPGADQTLRELASTGVSVRMITGDSRGVAAHVGGLVGLAVDGIMTGDEVDGLDDKGLAKRVGSVFIFAEIDPLAKERIIRAFRFGGGVVGYLGDGINDAPALHAADVGISVDTAVDVAKEAAAIVLLEKDLKVLLDGVREGRRTFANTMKYVYTTISANFGNVLSMAIAAAVLPFLPLLASQILLVNFLTDLPGTTIATDNIDPEQLDSPPAWDIGFLRAFMIVFGSLSSVFDLLTFAVLRLGFGADATLFRSGWFIESIATELAVMFVLRTRRTFFRSRPSRLLAVSSLVVAVLTLLIVYSPLAGPLELVGPAIPILLSLAGITFTYVVSAEITKAFFYASRWGRRAGSGRRSTPAATPV